MIGRYCLSLSGESTAAKYGGSSEKVVFVHTVLP